MPLNFPFKNPLKNSDGIKRTGQNFHTVKQRSQDHTGKHDRDMCLSSEVPRQTKCTPTDFALRFLANTRLPLQSLRVGFFPFQRKTLKRTSPKLWVISVQKNNNNKKKKWQTHKKWVLQKKTSIEGTTETFPLWSQSYRRQSGLTTHSGKPVRGIPKLLCRPRAMFRSGSRILISKINKINKNTSQHPFLNLKAQLSWRGERRTTLIVCFHSLGIKHWKWSP